MQKLKVEVDLKRANRFELISKCLNLIGFI